VAVGYGGCQQELGWSDQPSAVAVWNLGRPLVNTDKPDHVLPGVWRRARAHHPGPALLDRAGAVVTPCWLCATPPGDLCACGTTCPQFPVA
jgi:hypothetical protein